MNKYRITFIDSATGEIVSETIESYGWPATLCEPYYGMVSMKTGYILRVERSLNPSPENRFS
jgi:hypothetical protein